MLKEKVTSNSYVQIVNFIIQIQFFLYIKNYLGNIVNKFYSFDNKILYFVFELWFLLTNKHP